MVALLSGAVARKPPPAAYGFAYRCYYSCWPQACPCCWGHRPVGAGTLTDLTLAYLNPAAQRMTRRPAQPGTTYQQQFPITDANGA